MNVPNMQCVNLVTVVTTCVAKRTLTAIEPLVNGRRPTISAHQDMNVIIDVATDQAPTPHKQPRVAVTDAMTRQTGNTRLVHLQIPYQSVGVWNQRLDTSLVRVGYFVKKRDIRR